jgi:predicted nucleic acid-binding protein
MLLTIDTSCLIAVCQNELSKPAIVQASKGASLIAPRSVFWEYGNAVSAHMKRGRLDLSLARKSFEQFTAIPITWVDVDMLLALQIADQFRMYAYDSYLLCCARSHRTPLLTLDTALALAASNLGVDTVEL